MKQFDFSTLRILVAVAKTGSLSKAAGKVHLAVAAVSRRIADLEGDVGTALFTRHARGVELTPAGRTMLQHAREILLDVERMRADMKDYSRGARGHVRVGAITSAITQYLPAELKTFSGTQARVRVELRELTSDAIVAALSDHLIDIGIFVPTFAFSGLDATPITPISSRSSCRAGIASPAARALPWWMRLTSLSSDSRLRARWRTCSRPRPASA